jgi:hypothetical protein
MKYGFPEADWESAKAEAREIMIDRARLRGMIPYSELLSEVTSIRLEPNDHRLAFFLDEISTSEDDQGRGLLTVLVVHKNGDMQPGPGFFELAKKRGRDTTDILKCWVDELHRVHAVWKS